MNKFKVGDKVERVSFSVSLELGGVYEVSSVVNDSIRVKGSRIQYKVENFKLVQPVYPNPPHKHAELIKANLGNYTYENGDLVCNETGDIVGSLDSKGYLQTKIQGNIVLVHHIIYYMFNGDFPEQVDHIDRNRTNNLVTNLRASDNSHNQHNTELRKDNTSGYKGVSFKKSNNCWVARISVRGTRIHLGHYASALEANNKYEKAKELFKPIIDSIGATEEWSLGQLSKLADEIKELRNGN